MVGGDMVCLGEKTITKWDHCRKLKLFAYSSSSNIYVFLVLSSISSPAFVKRHKTKKLFQLTNSSEHFFVLFSCFWQIGFCIFCGICLSLRTFLKVATVNDSSWLVRFVYIVFGYNFNTSKGVSHSFAVKIFWGQMSDTLGGLSRHEIIKIATSIHTKTTPFMLLVIWKLNAK